MASDQYPDAPALTFSAALRPKLSLIEKFPALTTTAPASMTIPRARSFVSHVAHTFRRIAAKIDFWTLSSGSRRSAICVFSSIGSLREIAGSVMTCFCPAGPDPISGGALNAR